MTTKYPQLRSRVRRRASGRVVIYYYYDRRAEKMPDVPLGTDYDLAIEKWTEIRNNTPRVAGTMEEAFGRWIDEVLPTYTNDETRRGYTKSMRQIRPVFGPATWESVQLHHLKAYLRQRTGKTQANREMSLLSIVWNWARGEGLCQLPWPAAGMEKSRWRNKESARQFHVSDDLFETVYAHADPVLRDCMDVASSTGMRLTDVINLLMPQGDLLRLTASKTGKSADFDMSLSSVLPELAARRRALRANHLMLLSTPRGQPVTYAMLRGRWDKARAAAAAAADADGHAELAAGIRAMFLRDMRKRAADLAEDLEGAAKLLQHGSTQTTRRHYRTRAAKLAPVR